ncbi:hypothetical protein GmRootA79_04090 [Acidovorax sp. A79]|uniref:hypothetical protein n=1 Tax=Acidovorax sp. A79 TaxID=3056107 RepID=UPI0034E88116
MKIRPGSQSTPQPPAVDGLAFILAWSYDRLDQDTVLQKLRSSINKLIESGACERAYFGKSRYRENFNILLAGGSKALVQIGAVDTVRQKGGIRIECNPAKFADGDAQQIHRVMRGLIGRREYNELMRRPLLNVVHFAVDIYHAALTRMLVRYDNAQRMSMMAKRVGKGGFIEGYNFGSVRSDYETTAYNKQQELVHAAILAIAQSSSSGFNDDPLKSNKIKQLKRVLEGPEIVRVEVRGKKMRGLPLWKLPQQTNRFARFHFADLSVAGIDLDPLIEKAFLAMCRQDGVKAALDAFKHTEHARKVHAFWRSHQATWWKPGELWLQACDALRETRMFPPEAFESPDSHAEKQPVKRRRAR